jgi:response regulator RpfG family c-di-GMP phosphodiesterase
MSKAGPIIIIEDDTDDKATMEFVLKEMNVKNKVIWFPKCREAFKYLKTTFEKPFIIFCDINLPGENGIEFKKSIDADKILRKKNIPFVFYTTGANRETIIAAYNEMTVQGFFQKGNTFTEIQQQIKVIIDYWKLCRHPDSG